MGEALAQGRTQHSRPTTECKCSSQFFFASPVSLFCIVIRFLSCNVSQRDVSGRGPLRNEETHTRSRVPLQIEYLFNLNAIKSQNIENISHFIEFILDSISFDIPTFAVWHSAFDIRRQPTSKGRSRLERREQPSLGRSNKPRPY